VEIRLAWTYEGTVNGAGEGTAGEGTSVCASKGTGEGTSVCASKGTGEGTAVCASKGIGEGTSASWVEIGLARAYAGPSAGAGEGTSAAAS
jgi:hypothetical protein